MAMTIGEFALAFIAAMGVPGAITGFIVWRFQRKIEKRDSEREQAAAEQEKAREDLQILHTQGTLAAITLAKATARAVERIPDAHCNGDMHAALDYAEVVERKIRDFLQTQGVKAVVK